MRHVSTTLAFITLLFTSISVNAQLPPPSNPPAQVTLAWDAVTNAAYYKVYYGASGSRYYTNFVNVTNGLQVTIKPLTRGATYYFAATTVDTNGLESDWSSEVSSTPSKAPQPPVLRLVLGNGMIQGTGSPFESFSIERTQDFTFWQSIGETRADALGRFSFTDTNPPMPIAFYRTRS